MTSELEIINDYEQEIPSRPHRIHWHGKFLRSYSDEEAFEQGIKFFSGFLIDITHHTVEIGN